MKQSEKYYIACQFYNEHKYNQAEKLFLEVASSSDSFLLNDSFDYLLKIYSAIDDKKKLDQTKLTLAYHYYQSERFDKAQKILKEILRTSSRESFSDLKWCYLYDEVLLTAAKASLLSGKIEDYIALYSDALKNLFLEKKYRFIIERCNETKNSQLTQEVSVTYLLKVYIDLGDIKSINLLLNSFFSELIILKKNSIVGINFNHFILITFEQLFAIISERFKNWKTSYELLYLYLLNQCRLSQICNSDNKKDNRSKIINSIFELLILFPDNFSWIIPLISYSTILKRKHITEVFTLESVNNVLTTTLPNNLISYIRKSIEEAKSFTPYLLTSKDVLPDKFITIDTMLSYDEFKAHSHQHDKEIKILGRYKNKNSSSTLTKSTVIEQVETLEMTKEKTVILPQSENVSTLASYVLIHLDDTFGYNQEEASAFENNLINKIERSDASILATNYYDRAISLVFSSLYKAAIVLLDKVNSRIIDIKERVCYEYLYNEVLRLSKHYREVLSRTEILINRLPLTDEEMRSFEYQRKLVIESMDKINSEKH